MKALIPGENNAIFFRLWNLKCARNYQVEQSNLDDWDSFEIYAKTTKDLVMNVWNGTHPVEKNTTKHICKAGTRVRVWMVSRLGDVGVTVNLENPKGYDIRGLNPDLDLTEYEFMRKKNNIEELASKITRKNFLLLDDSDRNSEYELQKLYDWQEDYSWVEWNEFKNSWFYCDRCKGYSEGQCICYAR